MAIEAEITTTTTTTTTNTTTSTSTTTTSNTTILPDPPTTENVLYRSVWLDAVKKQDGHFYYKNDESMKVDSELSFSDHTSTSVDEKCAAILPDADNPSKFHLHSIDCENRFKAFCRANATIPTSGENLPTIPCVQMLSRKKRETEDNQCDNVETSANACDSIVEGSIYMLGLEKAALAPIVDFILLINAC